MTVKESNWGLTLKKFADRRGISIRKMSNILCGPAAGFAPGTVHRLMQGGASARYLKTKQLEASEAIRTFLVNQRCEPATISKEICEIFGMEEAPVIATRSTLTKETQRWFDLNRDPFFGEPSTIAQIFTSPRLDHIAGKIEDAIRYQHFIAVLGGVGTGKTLMKKRVMDKVKKSDGAMIFIWPELFRFERVTDMTIVDDLLKKLGQIPCKKLSDRKDQLQEQLAHLSEEGINVAIGIDECHHLHDHTLTALKNFWELGTGGLQRYLGVVLFGQPRFRDRLRDVRFQEIAERCEIVEMPSLEKNAWAYVEHRIKCAGGKPEEIIERAVVARLVQQVSTPQALGNQLNALMTRVHLDYNDRKVLAKHVETTGHGVRVRSITKRSDD